VKLSQIRNNFGGSDEEKGNADNYGWLGTWKPSLQRCDLPANVPFIKSLYSKYAHCELITSGEAVGLPKRSNGYSEWGTMNIGAYFDTSFYDGH